MSKCMHLTFVVFLCLGITELNFKAGLSLGCQEYHKLPIDSFLLKLPIEKETFIDFVGWRIQAKTQSTA